MIFDMLMFSLTLCLSLILLMHFSFSPLLMFYRIQKHMLMMFFDLFFILSSHVRCCINRFTSLYLTRPCRLKNISARLQNKKKQVSFLSSKRHLIWASTLSDSWFCFLYLYSVSIIFILAWGPVPLRSECGNSILLEIPRMKCSWYRIHPCTCGFEWFVCWPRFYVCAVCRVYANVYMAEFYSCESSYFIIYVCVCEWVIVSMA